MPELSLILVPGREELSNYTGSNSYYCGLEEIRESIDELLITVTQQFFNDDPKNRNEWPMLNSVEVKQECGFEPEVIFKLALTLVSGTVGISFFKLLKMWIEERNGRKIRVKLPNGFEVDTTQLKHKEFSKLFEELHSTYVESFKAQDLEEFFEYEKKFLQSLEEKNLTILKEEDLYRENSELKEIYWEVRKRLREN